MTISEISKGLDAALATMETKKTKVKDSNDKRAAVVADLDLACEKAAKEFSEAVGEAHKLRDALHAELAKIPSLGHTMAGVVVGISK